VIAVMQHSAADPTGNSICFFAELMLHEVKKECFARHEDTNLQNKR